MLTIVRPKTPEQFDAVRALCWEYRDFLVSLGGRDAEVVLYAYPQDKFERLMQSLEAQHAPPDGGIRLALVNGSAVGCGMFQCIGDQTAEIKRVFVRDIARGTGAGRALMEALIADCRALGFKRILMDTGSALTAAQKLYQSLGFVPRGPYSALPKSILDGLVFFEMNLEAEC